MRKIAVILLIIISLCAGVFFYLMKRADVHHSQERREWKDAAIMAIQNDLKATDYLNKRFGDHSENAEWLTADTILCSDGSWLAYRGQCHKEDPKVHDIFIAKASNGKWYYSDFHFCKEMMVLASGNQPESLDEFKHQYFLASFDGKSDDALEPTWNAGERRDLD